MTYRQRATIKLQKRCTITDVTDHSGVTQLTIGVGAQLEELLNEHSSVE